MDSIPQYTWSRRFDAKEPDGSVHNFSRPPIGEAISLLPIAYRVGTYISGERSRGCEPIFDLSGLCLEPPKPGPHAGAPLGGLGGGCIGRGFRGEFRRWSLEPGRYIHRVISADAFCLRVKRGDAIYSKVLSVQGQPAGQTASSPLASLSWGLPVSCGTYHALYPRSWTVFENPVPGIRVVIEQVSPFLPDSYSEASMPCAAFLVDVQNTDPTSGAEVSVMFCFQNGYGGGTNCTACSNGASNGCCTCAADQLGGDAGGNLVHRTFSLQHSQSSGNASSSPVQVTGVCMTHPSAASSGSCCGGTGGTAACSDGAGASKLPPGEQTAETVPTETQSTSSTPLVPDSPLSAPVAPSMQTSSFPRGTGTASFSIAAHLPASDSAGENPGRVSTCRQFITDVSAVPMLFPFFNYLCGGGSDATAESLRDLGASSRQLWDRFQITGDISDCEECRDGISLPGTRVGGAVCVRQYLGPASEGSAGSSKVFPFSLAWDDPYVRFGEKRASSAAENIVPAVSAAPPAYYPRYYTRFFGRSGLASPNMAAYALLHVQDWRQRIVAWQAETLRKSKSAQQTHVFPAEPGQRESTYYASQLFNELYFLADGGTVWLDSTAGISNQSGADTVLQEDTQKQSKQPCADQFQQVEYDTDGPNSGSANSSVSLSHLQRVLSNLDTHKLDAIHAEMTAHDQVARACGGDQRVVGQFLYLEGHEYLMYNTYDVHFYASFALLMLWPQLELSLQRDFARSVAMEDASVRVMMGTGESRPRKVKGVVPHDLGSPSEQPWVRTNAYNFQDVSRWKDLGPKFVLQVYRDFRYLRGDPDAPCDKNDKNPGTMDSFLAELYPVLQAVMRSTEAFDADGDGMIENGGFPDQTYDIWTATGVHAYCGGLWVAACEAMAKMATLCAIPEDASYYTSLAARARRVYVEKLWNGRYLNYDSSKSAHHDSIMADMLAGQWYARACGLPAVLPPRQAYSCFRTIFQHNVVEFGGGRLLGAVNGMRPPASYSTAVGSQVGNSADATGTGGDEADSMVSPPLSAPIVVPSSAARVDNSCMQSREVWTGTTYALAAAMIQEATYTTAEGTDGCDTAQEDTLRSKERAELLRMAHRTAQGIHDGGWQEFGYWFATPEAWEQSGNYRSLGYMRALGIWAIQFAKENNV